MEWHHETRAHRHLHLHRGVQQPTLFANFAFGHRGCGRRADAGQSRGPRRSDLHEVGHRLSGVRGVAGGDVPGTFAATVLSREPFDNGTIVQLEAEYRVTAADPAHSFVVLIEGKQNNPTQQAVLNGTVIGGWLVGAQVHVTFDVIVPAPGTRCVPAAPVNSRCFQGTIRILPGSAN